MPEPSGARGAAQPDSPGFYDRHWSTVQTATDPHIADKGELILRMVPPDVRTVVDVGCGDGFLTHLLATRFDVLAVDRSAVALSRVKVRTIQASADELPLEDRSTDLAFSSEVLEHLPDGVYERATAELARISRRYVLVTVPNRENLRRRYARCPRCRLEFHVDGHLRAFDVATLDALFPEFRRVALEYSGAMEPPTFAPIELVRQRIAQRWWVWQGESLVCPGCDYDGVRPARRSASHRLVDRTLETVTRGLGRLLRRSERPYWLLALYRRR